MLARLLARTQVFEAALGRIAEGVCVYDPDWTLQLASDRYAELHGLDPALLAPGTAIETAMAQMHDRQGLSAQTAADYASWCRALRAEGGEQVRDLALADGRIVRASHWPLANGAWLVIHDDVTAEIAHANLVKDRLSLQTLIDTVPDYLWVKDADSRFLIANKALAADWGRETGEMVGLSDFDCHDRERAEAFRACEKAIIDTGVPMIDRSELIYDGMGNEKWFSSTKMPVKNAEGATFGIVGIARDITDLQREVVFREGQAKVLEMIAMSAPLGEVLERLVLLVEKQLSGILASVLRLSEDGTRLIGGASPNLHPDYVALTDGFPIGPCAGSCGTAAYFGRQVIVADTETDPLWQAVRDAARTYGYRSCWSTPIVLNEKVLGTFALYSQTVRSPTEHEMAIIDFATRVAGIAIERQAAEERIRHMASHDVLTGLANRSMLDALFARTIENARRAGQRVLVLFLDLDRFKSINDGLGHHVGDELLKEVAARLTGCVGDGETVIRLGGDEFVVLLTNRSGTADEGAKAVDRIIAAVAAPMTLGEHRLSTGCSIGIASFPEDGDDPATLLAKADIAMYRAKVEGRGRFAVHSSGSTSPR